MPKPTTVQRNGMITGLLLCVIALLASGCTPRMHMYAGQGLDMATTYNALELHDGFREANPFADDMQGVLLLKVAGIGFLETLAHWFPAHADRVYTIGAVFGYAAGVHNVYTVNR